MSKNPIDALSELAPHVLEAKHRSRLMHGLVGIASGDPVLDSSYSPLDLAEFDRNEYFKEAVRALEADPALATMLDPDKRSDACFTVGADSARQSVEETTAAIASSALRLAYFRNEPESAENLARLMVQNYEDLKRGVQGEKVRAYDVYGIAGLNLVDSQQISTPWGVIKTAPRTSVPALTSFQFRPATTAVLVGERLEDLHVSFGGVPDFPPPGEFERRDKEVRELLPLAFALGAKEARHVPTSTFRTNVMPFIGSFGAGASSIYQSHGETSMDENTISEVERWASKLKEVRADKFHIAATRIVSALAHRSDKSDALIDAVTALESLVGGAPETTFRVTAALSKLLRQDYEERVAFRKKLQRMYSTRSNVVHGGSADASTVAAHAQDAIDVAIATVRALYERGGDWLTYESPARSERLLLEP